MPKTCASNLSSLIARTVSFQVHIALWKHGGFPRPRAAFPLQSSFPTGLRSPTHRPRQPLLKSLPASTIGRDKTTKVSVKCTRTNYFRMRDGSGVWRQQRGGRSARFAQTTMSSLVRFTSLRSARRQLVQRLCTRRDETSAETLDIFADGEQPITRVNRFGGVHGPGLRRSSAQPIASRSASSFLGHFFSQDLREL